MDITRGFALLTDSTEDQPKATDAQGLACNGVQTISGDMNDTKDKPPLGFISIEVILHRPPGDPFNKQTWPFPLIRERVTGSSEAQVVCSVPYDNSFIDRFVKAGQMLAKRGAIGIITSCGFLAMAQAEYVDPCGGST
jgi:hypothetical protein